MLHGPVNKVERKAGVFSFRNAIHGPRLAEGRTKLESVPSRVCHPCFKPHYDRTLLAVSFGIYDRELVSVAGS